jgi:outer membrane protein OmpA-like peptidoglycan-associated protein
MWQTLSIVVVFLVLSIPLGLSLERIATEAVVGTRARTALESLVKNEGGRIYEFSTTFPQDAPVHIEAMVLSRKRDPKLSEKARTALKEALGQPVDLALAQVVAGSQSNFDQKALEELVAKSKEAIVRDMQLPHPNVAAELANETGLPPLDISVDDHAKQAVLRAHVETVAELASLRGTEARLNTLHPGWQVSIRPDAQAFQPISFGEGSATLDITAESDITDIIWALQREAIASVEIVGNADLSGSRSVNRRMALQRANAVAAKFVDSGIATKVRVEFPVPDQRAREGELGRAAFRRVLIRPAN